MTGYTAREELLRSVTKGPLTEEDALLWMVLLHTHEIHLRPGVLTNDSADQGKTGVTVLSPDTQRGAASVIAALWPDRTDSKRCEYTYWYWQYNTMTPYEVLDDVPQDQLERIFELRDALAKDPCVAAVVKVE